MRPEGNFEFTCSNIDLTEVDNNGNTYLVIEGTIEFSGETYPVRDKWYLHSEKKTNEENKKAADWRRKDLESIFGREITSADFQKMNGARGNIRIAWKAQEGYNDKLEIKAPYKEKVMEKDAAAVKWADLFGEEVKTNSGNIPF